MKSITKIRSSQNGWVVYFNNNVLDFYVFRSDEPERFVRFIAENVAGIKIDQLVEARLAERAAAERSFGA